MKAIEIAATLAGFAYLVLAVRRNRLCWILGALSALFMAAASAAQALPMQAGLQIYYVGMSVYGWWSWKRSAGVGEVPVRLWPLRAHLIAAVVLTCLSFASAQWLATQTRAAWPLLDSLTTWFSLLATWLVAQARLENWLYWIVIDGVLVFLYYAQDLPLIAFQMLVYMVVAAAGFVSWRRRLRAQAVAT